MSKIMKSKSISIVFFILLILVSSCGKEDEPSTKYDVTIATCPLYVNRHLYDSTIPICYLNDKLLIPIRALNLADPTTSDESVSVESVIFSEEGYIYVSEFDAWYCEYDTLIGLENYDCYIYDSVNDKQISIRTEKNDFDYSWTKGRIITHGMGEIDGYTYTNSLEAFEHNYELGNTIFEVDLTLNNYGELLCLHDFSLFSSFFGINGDDGRKFADYSVDEFKSLKIYDKYTPLDINDIVELMYAYTDVYIVTDTKSNSVETIQMEFNDIVQAAYDANVPEVLDRFIPQIHNEDMYYKIMEIYPWKSIIYTSYFLVGDDYSEKKMFDFAYDNGIKVITLFKSRGTPFFLEKCKEYGIKSYVHTYNTEEERRDLYNLGFYGLYSDTLLPEYHE